MEPSVKCRPLEMLGGRVVRVLWDKFFQAELLTLGSLFPLKSHSREADLGIRFLRSL